MVLEVRLGTAPAQGPSLVVQGNSNTQNSSIDVEPDKATDGMRDMSGRVGPMGLVDLSHARLTIATRAAITYDKQ